MFCGFKPGPEVSNYKRDKLNPFQNKKKEETELSPSLYCKLFYVASKKALEKLQKVVTADFMLAIKNV